MKRRAVTGPILALALGSATAMAAEWQSLPAIQSTVEKFVQEKAAGMRGERTVKVGQIDNRLKLARCDRMEAFQPGGARLSGNTSIGVRCLAPSAWSLYVTVQIKLVDDVLVVAQPVAAGQPLQASDLQVQRRDITATTGNVLNAPEQAVGKTAAAPLAAGTVLRAEALRAPNIVRQGQQVKLVAQGAGFRVSSEGLAMGNATLGQVVAVKTRSGQVIKGVARSEGVVEVYF